MDELLICTSCNAEIGTKFCPNCGNEAMEIARMEKPAKQRDMVEEAKLDFRSIRSTIMESAKEYRETIAQHRETVQGLMNTHHDQLRQLQAELRESLDKITKKS